LQGGRTKEAGVDQGRIQVFANCARNPG